MRGIVENLRKAKVDSASAPCCSSRPGFATPFWGKVQEIRDAVLDFRKSGKPIYAYLEYGGDRDYYLASAADKVFLMPSSPLDLTGVATYELFLRGTLDKIGRRSRTSITSATTRPRRTRSPRRATPPAHREMDQSLNRDLYEQIVRGIAEARKKTEADVRALIDEGPFLPEDALRAGLIDDVAYEDQVRREADGAGGSATARRYDDYARVSARSLGLEPRAAHRGHLRGRRDRQRRRAATIRSNGASSAPTR